MNGIAKNTTPITPRKRRSTILASVEISPKDTFLISQDIFNEPRRETLRNSGDLWVRMFTQRDEFLKGLIACVNNSPTLRRIISDKSSMCVGDGYIPIKGKSSSLLVTNEKAETITGDQLGEIETAIEKVNEHGETLAEVQAKGAFDYNAFGNAVFEIVKGKVGNSGFCNIYHVELYNVAIGRTGLDQIIREYALYDDFDNFPLTSDGTGYIDRGFRKIAAYPNFTDFEDGTQRSIIHIKQYAAGYTYFGLPEWVSARQWAELEYRIQRYNISKFDNSFLPSGILQLFGSASPAEAQKLVDKIEKKFVGTGNNHKMVIQVLRDEKQKAVWTPMTKEQEGEFLELQQAASEKIVTACGWSAALAGISTAGKLGSNQEIRSETEKVQNTVIKPVQNVFCNRVINPYLKELSAFVPALKDVQFGISNSTPVSFMGDINVEANLTVDEKRELLGYGAIEVETDLVTENLPNDGAINPTA
jgi:hypothetical protein